ncbi:S8 family serine peptidase [bacterium]|nr:S8 family serine peptidase [bacterium]
MTRFAHSLSQIFLRGCLIAGCLISLFGVASAQDGGTEPLDPLTVAPLPPSIEIFGPVEDDSTSGLAISEEMDSLLVHLLLQAGSDDLPPEAREDLADAGILIDGDRVQVQIAIDADTRADVVDLVTALGGSVSGASEDGRWLQGWSPILSLADLAQHPLIHYVRHPVPLVTADEPRGVVSSEALSAFNVTNWRRQGRTGRGVHVAVIDGGFAGYKDLLGVELPESVNAVNFVDHGSADAIEGSTAHGTGVAEIVYDVAPGIELSLLRINTNIDLLEAVHWAIRNDVDVIATSIGWYNLGPGDGTGELADMVAMADAAGILWVTSAGNDRERHWGGLFVDNDGDTRHEYRPFTEVLIFGPEPDKSYLIPSGYPIVLHLRWSDWTNIDIDFNLTLMRYDGAQWQTVARSQNMQNGSYGQTPTESIFYTTSGAAAPYGVVITHRSGVIDGPINFDLFAPRSLRFGRPVYERSVTDLGDAPYAITVGAIDAFGTDLPESYSAEGPTNGPGGAVDGGFLKPNLIAYTNVSTASIDRPFNGTSAATPHVAGAAVLVKQAYPDWTPLAVREFLYQRAQPLPEELNVSITRVGYGRLDLGNPPPRLVGSTISVVVTGENGGENGDESGSEGVGTAQAQTVISIVNNTALTATAELVHPIPAGINLLDSATASVDPAPMVIDGELTWQGDVPPDSIIEISYAASVSAASLEESIRLLATAVLRDGDGEEIPLVVFVNPVNVYLPVLAR